MSEDKSFAKQNEQAGYDWETLTTHICENTLQDSDYRKTPIGGEEKVTPQGVEDPGNEILIRGLRLLFLRPTPDTIVAQN